LLSGLIPVAVLDDFLYLDGGEISQYVNGEPDSAASRPGLSIPHWRSYFDTSQIADNL
jgi:hypothetical protein